MCKATLFTQVKQQHKSSVIGINIWLFSFDKKMSMQTSKIEGKFFLYLDKMKQKRRKAPCDWKVWYTTKVEQNKERRRSKTSGPGLSGT